MAADTSCVYRGNNCRADVVPNKPWNDRIHAWQYRKFLWKSSGLKCTEHMPELDVGTHSLPFLSFPRFTLTNLVHCFRRFLASGRSSFRNGNLWTTIPFGISLILSQPATMQQSGISVFHLHDADTSKLQRSRQKRKTRPGVFNKCL